MRQLGMITIAALTLALAAQPPASAQPITFNIDFTFEDGGMGSGSFDFDSSLAFPDAYSNAMVNVMGGTFAATFYNDVNGGNDITMQLINDPGFPQGEIFFSWVNPISSIPLGGSTDVLGEEEQGGNIRLIKSGTATAVPEPPAVGLLLWGGVMLLTRRR